jgi:hypothetical protein
MMFGDSDLHTFFADMGVDLTFNGVTVKAIEDTYDTRDSLSSSIVDKLDRVTLVQLPFNSFSPMPKRGDTVVLVSTSMKVRDVIAEKDGGVTQLFLVTP